MGVVRPNLLRFANETDPGKVHACRTLAVSKKKLNVFHHPGKIICFLCGYMIGKKNSI